MTTAIEQLTSQIQASSSTTQRTELADEILDQCQAHPAAIGVAEVTAIFNTLRKSEPPVRTRLSRGLFDVGKVNGKTMVPIAADILDFCHSSKSSTKVRINLARPLGDAVVSDPSVIQDSQVSTLCIELHDDEKWYRHSIAWVLEVLAYDRPDVLLPFHEELLKRLDDVHPPVPKHVCRALAHLERHRSFLESQHIDAVAKLIEHDDSSVRTAASITLGATGTQAAVNELRARYASESDTDVQVHIRHALREATFPAINNVLVDGSAKSIDTGQWVAVSPTRRPSRTGRFRGKVIETSGNCAQGVKQPGQAILENPYEGYELSIRFEGTNVHGIYRDERRSDPLGFTVDTLVQLDDDHIPLLYALEDDGLAAKLDRAHFDITVESVSHINEGRRVIGSDTNGNTIEFRPCERRPLLSRFHEGRCFETHCVSLNCAVRNQDPAE